MPKVESSFVKGPRVEHKKKHPTNRISCRIIHKLAERQIQAVAFDAARELVILGGSDLSAPRNDMDELPEGIRRLLARSGRQTLTAEVKQRIFDEVLVLVS